MLKTIQNERLFMVTQPDHAQIAGYLAAHWGNEEFNAPGYYFKSDDSNRLKDEIVLAVSEHDNGWWEWEAAPDLNNIDGLPLNLTEVLTNLQEGMDRWRVGLRRLSQNHPYASLLMSFHAYWLYAQNIIDNTDAAFIHPLVQKTSLLEYTFSEEKLENAQKFISEIKNLQAELITKVKIKTDCTHWLDEKHLKPNARFLQLMDGLSLSLCSNLIPPNKGEAKGLGEDEFDLLEVPRKGWQDRVKIKIKPQGQKRIVCEPYPFNIDPLPVFVPARIFDLPVEKPSNFQTHWHSQQMQLIHFEYCSNNK